MNNKAVKFLKNFSYTIASNLISLVISTLVILIIPKLIGVEEYGYWQLYLFYSSYVGLLHFGWSDGIYLRYGGREYSELDKRLFFSQFYMMVIFQVIIAIIISVSSLVLFVDNDKNFIFQMVSINLLIVNSLSVILFVLQGTNKIVEYSRITIISRITYVFLIFSFLFFGIENYKLMIVSDLLGKMVSFIYAIYTCKDIVFHKFNYFYFSFRETVENISAGIKLMIANIASLLIIGVVRFGIEHSWDVATFGKVSLTLSISNLLMIFINAVGIIIFPLLRRTNENKLASVYITIREVLMLGLIGSIIVYYPLKICLTTWLVNYSESFMYLALILPICIYEGKMALLINTYLKTLRKERIMLQVNITTLILSSVFTVITTKVLNSLTLAVLSIVVVLIIRCMIAELILSKIIGVTVLKSIIFELILTIIFVLTGWFVSSWLAALIYLLAYALYLFVKRNDISRSVTNLKKIFNG